MAVPLRVAFPCEVIEVQTNSAATFAESDASGRACTSAWPAQCTSPPRITGFAGRRSTIDLTSRSRAAG